MQKNDLGLEFKAHLVFTCVVIVESFMFVTASKRWDWNTEEITALTASNILLHMCSVWMCSCTYQQEIFPLILVQLAGSRGGWEGSRGRSPRRSCSHLQTTSRTGGITVEAPGFLRWSEFEENRRPPHSLSAPSGPTSEVKQDQSFFRKQKQQEEEWAEFTKDGKKAFLLMFILQLSPGVRFFSCKRVILYQ